MIKAVIFDLDGTLIDSEPHHFEADRHLLAKFKISIDEQMKNQYVGISAREMLVDLKKKFHLVDSVEHLLAEKNRLYLEIARENTRLFPEMGILLDKLKNSGYQLSVASGSSKAVIEEMLALTQTSNYFECFTSAEEVPKGKPDPAIFLETARRMGVQAKECVVLEDAAPGVQGAKKAGMLCIAIPSLHIGIQHPVFKTADLLFEMGMESFSAEETFEWIEGQKKEQARGAL